jgi:hypothetical protein
MLVLEQTRHRLRAPDRRPPGGAGGFVSSVATGKKKVAKVPKGVLGLGFGVRTLLDRRCGSVGCVDVGV